MSNLKLVGAGVSDITRYQGDSSAGMVQASVRLNFKKETPPSEQSLTMFVDLPEADALSIREIESLALAAAIELLTSAAQLQVSELEESFRSQFEERP